MVISFHLSSFSKITRETHRIATNVVDFMNELSALHEQIWEEAKERYTKPGEGFPPGFEYRWHFAGEKEPRACSSPEYMELVFEWVDNQINDDTIFPIEDHQTFPPNFITGVFSRHRLRLTKFKNSGEEHFQTHVSRLCD